MIELGDNKHIDDIEYKCILSWIFRLSKIMVFNIDKHHICTPKIKTTVDKRGEFLTVSEKSIELHSTYKNNFYGCIKCGKYHYCIKNIKKCPIIKREDKHICLFSGYTVENMEYVDKYEAINNFLKESTFLNKGKEYTAKKKNEKQKVNSEDKLSYVYIKNDLEEGPLNVEEGKNNEINLNYKAIANFSQCFDDILQNDKKSTHNSYSQMDDQLNPVNCDFKPILNHYFSYLDEDLSVIIDNLTPHFKKCPFKCFENKETIPKDINHSYLKLCENNRFYQKNEHNVNKEIDLIFGIIEENERLYYKNKNVEYECNVNKEEYYKPILSIIGLVYNSNVMHREFNKLYNKINTDKIVDTICDIDYEMFLTMKILDYKKMCRSLLLHLFLNDYMLKDNNGYNIFIWCKDHKLYEKSIHEKQLHENNEIGYKNIFFDNSYKTTSKSIKQALNEYHIYPLWLKSQIFK